MASQLDRMHRGGNALLRAVNAGAHNDLATYHREWDGTMKALVANAYTLVGALAQKGGAR